MKSFKKRQETVFEGHLNEVNSVVVTNDNKYVISGSNDQTLRIWNLFEKKNKKLFFKDI